MRRARVALCCFLFQACASPTATISIATPDVAPPTARRTDDPGWVEASAEVLASIDETPRKAADRAKAIARKAAIELVAGVGVKAGCVDYIALKTQSASTLNQCLTTVSVDALVIDEKLLEEKQEPIANGGGFVVRVRLGARVLDRSRARDSEFRAEVKLTKTRFFDGEDVELSVRASHDARIYVLNLSSDGATVLLPNAYVTDTRARANTWLHFPDETLRERGVRISVRMPEGERDAKETLIAIALKGERNLVDLVPHARTTFRVAESSGAGKLLAELLEPLFDLPPDAWTFDQVSYEVLAR